MDMKPNIFLRLARMDAGLTQEEMAEELDVSTMTVYRWESGQKMPSRFQRLRICALFGRSESELGWPGGEEEEEKPTDVRMPSCSDPSIPIGRPTLAGQREILKAMQSSCLAPPTGQRRIGMIGIPGSGKTAVVIALLAMPHMRRHFSGVLWATIGQTSTPHYHLARWAQLLGMETLPDDLEQAKGALRLAIGTRRMLIVLDDLWELDHLACYQIGGPACQYVLTTRQTSLAYNACDVVYRPTPLTTDQALHVLSSALPPLYAYEYQPLLRSVAEHVGNLPLALELARGYLRKAASSDSQRRIQAAVSQLAHPTCYLHLKGVTRGSMFEALQRSEKWLEVTARKALFCLATRYQSAPATFSEQQASETLRLQDLHIQDLDRLADSGLVEAVGKGRYQIHPIISAYMRLEGGPTS